MTVGSFGCSTGAIVFASFQITCIASLPTSMMSRRCSAASKVFTLIAFAISLPLNLSRWSATFVFFSLVPGNIFSSVPLLLIRSPYVISVLRKRLLSRILSGNIRATRRLVRNIYLASGARRLSL